MKTKTILTLALVAGMATALTSADKGPQTMTKEKGVYIVNTTNIASDVIGYEGPTPLVVYIKKNKIEKVEYLPNQETPKYWNAVKKHFQDTWTGKTVKEAKEMQVDGRTGATYSSDAVKENIKRALEYYEKNK
jgi:electron transport complex protein RnfG